ncbi:ABC transporter permease subunit [Mesorhizobium sp. CA13]|uniref:ABC transporter permease subunit n=1 Tax=Mesorhizobium sp. CA13 TaxID=2876643 RepID=UPI001CCDB50D|nr:ABC transporter permease subunit [Mesorhizobium sp. CA13]MBZ9855000.1 ABC transporter permease subunit [Mesorhizobium sp. CA13]
MLAILLFAVYGAETGSIVAQIAARTPLLLTGSPDFSSLTGGFSANIIISFWAMLLSILFGTILGIGLIAEAKLVRVSSEILMNVLRNSPWLVVLYAMLYLLPFEITLFGSTFFLSPLVKSVIGLSLPASANVAEVFRGGIEAIASGQWESARSLGYRRLQILRHVIFPQALPLMTPNLMTIYTMLFIGTSLVVVTGTSDVLSVVRIVTGSDGDDLATGLYIYVLLLFFLFSFPIAILTRSLERRVQAK